MVVAQADSIDEIDVGIDNLEPSINSIDPDPNGVMNGMYRWFSDITDDLSGVEQVDFYLIEKDNFNYCADVNTCWLGAGAIVWSQTSVDFNTDIMQFYYDLNTLNHPDGDYNVGFGATDIAGNYAYMEIDPIIDNTKPVINSVVVPNTVPITRGTTVTVNVNVTDNLSGVDSVWATITRPDLTVDKIFLTGTEPVYTGSYVTDTTFPSGNYVVQIDANDFATNTAVSQTTDFNLFYSYLVETALNDYSVTQGDSVTIDGNVFADDGSIIGDFNVNLVLPTGDVLVAIDAITGQFSYVYDTSSTSAGTFDVNAEAEAPNGVTTVAWKILSIANPPTQPASPGAPGGPSGPTGGSGSTAGLQISFEGDCVDGEVSVRVGNVRNNPVEGASVAVIFNRKIIENHTTNADGVFSFTPSEEGKYSFKATKGRTTSTIEYLDTVICPEEQPEETPPVDTGEEDETPPGEEEPEDGAGEEEPPTDTPPEEEQPTPGPTGFFGLSALPPGMIIGLLLLIGAILIGVGFKRFKK